MKQKWKEITWPHPLNTVCRWMQCNGRNEFNCSLSYCIDNRHVSLYYYWKSYFTFCNPVHSFAYDIVSKNILVSNTHFWVGGLFTMLKISLYRNIKHFDKTEEQTQLTCQHYIIPWNTDKSKQEMEKLTDWRLRAVCSEHFICLLLWYKWS